MNRDGDRTVDSGGAVRLLTREDDCDGDGDGTDDENSTDGWRSWLFPGSNMVVLVVVLVVLVVQVVQVVLVL